MTILNSKMTILLYDNYKNKTKRLIDVITFDYGLVITPSLSDPQSRGAIASKNILKIEYFLIIVIE